MKKGFTLIELLAVIVILAIIALIASPIVIGIIEDTRKSGAQSSVVTYMEEMKKSLMKIIIDGRSIKSGFYLIEDGKIITPESEEVEVNVSGEIPNEGLVCINNKGNISGGLVKISDYVVEFEGTNTKIVENYELSRAMKCGKENKEYGDMIYFDPKAGTDGEYCTNYVENNSNTGVKQGCMKWYYIGSSAGKDNYILDHNTTASIAWISRSDFVTAGGADSAFSSYGNTDKGNITVINKLNSDTSGWKVSARLIEANEIAKITGADVALQWEQTKPWGEQVGTSIYAFNLAGSENGKNTYSTTDGWRKANAKSKGASKFAWLYDRTSSYCENYGCANNAVGSNTNGYWTNNKLTSNKLHAWYVSLYGELNTYYSSYGNGVRPVISI